MSGCGYGRSRGEHRRLCKGGGRQEESGGEWDRVEPPWTSDSANGYQPVQLQLPPPPPNSIRATVCVDDDNGLESRVSPVFARAPYILFIDIVNGLWLICIHYKTLIL